jgi:hypothetical protein
LQPQPNFHRVDGTRNRLKSATATCTALKKKERCPPPSCKSTLGEFRFGIPIGTAPKHFAQGFYFTRKEEAAPFRTVPVNKNQKALEQKIKEPTNPAQHR